MRPVYTACFLAVSEVTLLPLWHYKKGLHVSTPGNLLALSSLVAICCAVYDATAAQLARGHPCAWERLLSVRVFLAVCAYVPAVVLCIFCVCAWPLQCCIKGPRNASMLYAFFGGMHACAWTAWLVMVLVRHKLHMLLAVTILHVLCDQNSGQSACSSVKSVLLLWGLTFYNAQLV